MKCLKEGWEFESLPRSTREAEQKSGQVHCLWPAQKLTRIDENPARLFAAFTSDSLLHTAHILPPPHKIRPSQKKTRRARDIFPGPASSIVGLPDHECVPNESVNNP